jgi:hypothetical protein
MPRFDGTGPRGGGPMTGRGEGYCIMELPEPGRTALGYAGQEGVPFRLEPPAPQITPWPPRALGHRAAFRWGRGRAARQGRCRRLHGW